ncbi:MAG: hypothetical protein AAGD34_08080 [Pseudomonadota bacterium]
MPNIFKGITNGGANRFWFNGEDDSLVFKVAGADVGGRESFTDVNDFIDRAAELFDVQSTNGSANYDGSGELQYGIIGADQNVVKLGPGNHNGSAKYTFDSAEDAANFMSFLEALDTAGDGAFI